jgi:hypothetical protein
MLSLIYQTETMTHTVKAHYIICTTLAIIDLALQSSWSGYNIIAEYNGTIYELYKDNEGATHEALMRIVAPNICDNDSVDTMCSKYQCNAVALTKDWPAFDTYPEIEIDPSLMAYELKRSYNLI